MSTSVTKIAINSDEAGITVIAQFNPKTLSLKKSSGVTRDSQSTNDSEKLSYKGGEQFSITLDLLFDTTEDSDVARAGDDVHIMCTKPLFDLMKSGDYDGEFRPPLCELMWGQDFLNWKANSTPIMKLCYVQSVNADYTLFSADARPLRAQTKVTLKEFPTPLEYTNPTSRTEARRIWRVVGNETLQLIAHKEYGNSAMWRLIAEANDMDDPRRLRPGQLLRLPTLEEPRPRRRR